MNGGEKAGPYALSVRAGFMQTVIVVIHLMVVAAMIGVVLLQKSEGGGLGIGSTGGFLSSRGTSNVLTRTTAILAGVFFATSLMLSILAGWDRKPHSVIQGTPAQQTPGAPLGQGGGILDTLRQRQTEQPPAPPSGPQIPRSQ
jgi:preprotein translocase subunit SecG